MAVLISANGPTNLSTTNGFYKVESFNMGGGSSANTLLGTSYTSIYGSSITFSNAANILGICLDIVPSNNLSYLPTCTVTAALQQIMGTVTITIASPGVVTLTSHGLSDGTQVCFSTTGALPGNISITGLYYVRNSTANTFQLSSTPSGAIINTIGTQSGTHTLYAFRASKTLDITQMISYPSNPGNTTSIEGDLYVPFVFTNSYAVDTTASKWRFVAFTSSVANSLFYLRRSGGTGTEIYATWSDTPVTFSNNDSIICLNTVTIDQTATVKGIAGNGSTTNSCAIQLCTPTGTPGINNPQLKWAGSPASSYTLTIDGSILFGAHSCFAIGTPASPIPYAQRAVLDFTVSTTTGGNGSRLNTMVDNDANAISKAYIYWFGSTPTTTLRTTLNGAVANGASSITTNDVTNWVAGDLISIGNSPKNGSSANRAHYTVTSTSGTTVNVSPVISGARTSGGTVMKISADYGIKVLCPAAAFSRVSYSIMQFKGVEFSSSVATAPFFQNNSSNWLDNTNNNNSRGDDVLFINDESFFDTCSVYTTNINSGVFISQTTMLQANLRFENMNFHNCFYASGGTQWISKSAFTSGRWTIKNCRVLNANNGSTGLFGAFSAASPSASAKITIQDNSVESCNHQQWNLQGISAVETNNNYHSIYDPTYGASFYRSLTGPVTISGNVYNNCSNAIVIGGYPSLNVQIVSPVFNNLVANTTDIKVQAGAYTDVEFVNAVGVSTIDNTELPLVIDGSYVKYTNYNGSANNDWDQLVYGQLQRTGNGLTDTTVHTSGSNRFGIRLQSNNATNPLVWSFKCPTGNIQNMTMTVAVWCKINNAAYYTGTYQYPRLNINYDNGTVVYSQAQASTGWQLLSCTFTPTTTFGQIIISLSTKTDAVGSGAYVYFDDFSVLYPAGYKLDMGGMDLWANALPVTPPISTVISANDVWNVDVSTAGGSGTMGKKLSDSLTTKEFIVLKDL